ALFADGVAPVSAAAAMSGEEPLTVIGPSREVTEFLNRLGVKSPLAASARVTGRAWTGRTRSGRAILAAEANDAESLAAMARPLPHYRRESWITFNGRSVLGHGVWAAGDGGLVRLLDGAAK
ncbi:MAG TPA: M1 family peptidase, partial [Azospirillaceae bacterium]|nr:M1 family peptidase [Azospirillaceae bacterium]